jgi:hypothetical protein
MDMTLPSVKFFLRCNCGLKFCIEHVADGKTQFLLCDCEQELKFFGTAIRAQAGKRGLVEKERIWLEVPEERFKAQ